MTAKNFIILLAVLALAALAWTLVRQPNEPATLARLLGRAAAKVTPSVRAEATSGVGGPRKCRSPSGQLTYTDAPCPPGAHVEAMEAGTVTVVSGQRIVASPDGAASVGLLRSLAGPDLGDLKQKQIDRAIGQ